MNIIPHTYKKKMYFGVIDWKVQDDLKKEKKKQ